MIGIVAQQGIPLGSPASSAGADAAAEGHLGSSKVGAMER